MKFSLRIISIWLAVAALLTLHSCADVRHGKAEKALEKGQKFLLSIQNEDGAIADTVNPLFGLWETALALKALAIAGTDSISSEYQQGLAYLQANAHENGLICHNRKCRAGYCLETSAVYLQLPGIRRKNEAAVEAMLALQDSTGAWAIGNPDVREAQRFPSVTGFVIGFLQSQGIPKEKYQNSLQWLLEQQKADATWGQHWEYYDSPAYAFWAILPVLKNCEEAACQSAHAKAVDFLINSQAENGSWKWSGQAWANQPSTELHTALSLLAILSSASPENQSVTQKAADFLISAQRPDGSWDGGNFPIESKRYVKQEYVAATAWAMLALRAFIDMP